MGAQAVTPVRWGVLSTARIGLEKVIPALQASSLCDVVALASRDGDRALAAAAALGIPRAHDSYEALLADETVEAVYNPLPNHLHVSWSIRAMEAGKHVLCEKPIGLNAEEARRLLEAQDRTGMTVAEAFMIRTHPQWQEVTDRVRRGDLGPLRLVACQFSYFNDDPHDIRNRPEYGGGGLMDIGCYAVHVSRWLFDAEPQRVLALVERDPEQGVDTLASGILDFGTGHATFTCGTRHVPYQRVQILGARGRIEVEIPFNAPPDQPCRVWLDDGSDLSDRGRREIVTDPVDQYTTQGEAFVRAIRTGGDVPIPLESAVGNMATIDALFRSAESGGWQAPAR